TQLGAPVHKECSAEDRAGWRCSGGDYGLTCNGLQEAVVMEKFLAAVRNMFNVPDLRRRIFFTLGLLAIYRLGAHIGAPGINKVRLDEAWRDVAGTLLGVLDRCSGGNCRTIS